MQTPTDPLELAVWLYKARDQDSGYGRDVEIKIPEICDFSGIVTAIETANLLVDSDEANRTIEFTLPYSDAAPFFITVDDLLKTGQRRIAAPKRFYVAELDYLYSGNVETVPNVIRCYLETSKLLNLIRTVADHIAIEGTDERYVFLGKEKLIFTTEYSERDLHELNDLEQFQQQFFDSDTHAGQKKTIVRTVLLDIFKGNQTVPFASLLHCYSSFNNAVKNSYDLYVSEFSFHKIKAEVEKEKLDLTTKLNKVFSDIQNQLLAIPVALILAGGQIESSHDWTLKNILIWLGAFVFMLLMSMLIRNQQHTLDAVKQEIDQQWLDMNGRHQAVAHRFQDAYSQLEKRYLHQHKLLTKVRFLVTASFLTTTLILLWYSLDLNIFL